MKVVEHVSDPPDLSQEDLREMKEIVDRIHVEFIRRTAPMEILSGKDLTVLVR